MSRFLKIIENSLGVLRSIRFLLCVSLVSLYGCHTAPEMVSTPVTGFNHTSAAINRFSVNGAGGHPVSAFQGGATQVCCGMLPAQWNPDLRATIEWEKDPNPREMIKRDKYGQFDKEDYKRHVAHYSRHEATVEIPKYGSDFCAIQVHFLPCDQIRISTTCFAPRNINYPDDSLFQLEGSVICPVL